MTIEGRSLANKFYAYINLYFFPLSLQHFNHGLTKFEDRCPHVVTHTYDHPKSGVEVLWTAPPAGTGCVEFRYTQSHYRTKKQPLTQSMIDISSKMENETEQRMTLMTLLDLYTLPIPVPSQRKL